MGFLIYTAPHDTFYVHDSMTPLPPSVPDFLPIQPAVLDAVDEVGVSNGVPNASQPVGHQHVETQQKDEHGCTRSGLVTNSILLCWLFIIKDCCKKVRFQQMHNQGLCQFFLAVLGRLLWRHCSSVAPEATHKASPGPLKGTVSTQKALRGFDTETRELRGVNYYFLQKGNRKNWVSGQTCTVLQIPVQFPDHSTQTEQPDNFEGTKQAPYALKQYTTAWKSLNSISIFIISQNSSN